MKKDYRTWWREIEEILESLDGDTETIEDFYTQDCMCEQLWAIREKLA